VRDEVQHGAREVKGSLTEISRTAIGFGCGCVPRLTVRYCGSRGNNPRGSCDATEMFADVVSRGSFTPVLVPTLLDHSPRASAKANVLRLVRFARPLALYDT